MYVRGKAFCFKPLKIKDLVRGNHLGSLKGPNIIVSTNCWDSLYEQTKLPWKFGMYVVPAP